MTRYKLKSHFSSKVVCTVTANIDTKDLTANNLARHLTLLDAVHLLCKVWRFVKQTRVSSYSRKAVFHVTTKTTPGHSEPDSKLQFLKAVDADTFRDYICLGDDDHDCHNLPTDKEIFTNHAPATKQIQDENSDYNSPPEIMLPMTNSTVLHHFAELRHLMEECPTSSFDLIYQFEDFIQQTATLKNQRIYSVDFTKTLILVPKLRLLCCGISSIHIVAFSSVNITAKALNLPECLRQLFFRVGVNIKELLGVVETVNVMTSKFGGLVSSRTVTAIMQKLIPSTMLEACSSRNTLDEILSSPHHCCLMEEKQRPFIIPRVVEILDILKFSETVIENLMDEGRYNLNRQRENKKLSMAVYWLHHCEKVLSSDNKMLIGILKPCSVTGKMVLQDRTGKVFVLIKKDERDVSIDSNMISKSSLCELCNGNRVVALSRYRVVYEQFQVCDLQRPEQFGDIQYVQKHSEIIYVECSIEDIEIINSESSSDLERQSKYSELIFVEKKEALILEGTNPESSLLRFNVKGYSLGKLRDFDDKECLLAQGKCVSTMFDGQSSSQTRGNLTHKCSPESRVFIFDGNAARWHSIIEENVLYRISSSKELSAVTMKQYSVQLQKVIERADKKACVQLPEDVEMLRMTCQLHGAKCPNPEFVMSQMTRESLSSITDILSSSCCSTFVSFKGEVIHRSHSDIRASDVISPSLQDAMSSHCVGTLDNRNIMLIVKCMDTGNQIQVFLTLQNMAYPLGLHPGAVIIFRRLERRQKNDRVYCQYICISSIDVMGFEKEDRGEHREETTSQYRNQVLKEMEGIKELHREESQVAVFDYIANGNFGNPFSCVAYIRWMIKLSLKCVCVNCHGVISSGKCDAGQCSGNEGFQFVARATAVFDDGTGSGIASFTGDGVRALLTLTQEQWISIQELVLQKGEIFIDENTPCVDAIEKFLSALCTSSVIKSPHVITLSVQKDRQNLDKHTDLNACKLEDLPLKLVDVGGESVSIRTRFLPASYFYCLTIRPLDNTEWTQYNLR
ncbi:hypothetical protein FSP39_006829 [Pinctada imbricata]|uniref:CST complex subunit CTC1 n=1 Tax=Pinctada imbricata TaxID=66713 RepID=A0AA88Y9I1_PINIB|nr:hypothetical protein FSP39_006829 [Pinctada imbricata]